MNRLSIIIPSLANGPMLHQAIRSVLTECDTKASPENFEVECIVVASWPDRGALEGLPLKDSRFKLLFANASNAAGAVNQGLSVATGNLFGILSSDDEYMPGALTQVTQCFDENPESEAVYGKATLVDINSTPFKRDRIRHPSLQDLSQSLCMCPSAIFYRRSLKDRIGALNEEIQYRARFEFLVRAFAAGCRFSRVSSIVTGKRIHPGNTLSNRNDKSIAVKSLQEIVSIVDHCLDVKLSRWNLRLGRALTALDGHHWREGIAFDRKVIANACHDYELRYKPDAKELKLVRNQLWRMHLSRELYHTMKRPKRAVRLLTLSKKRKQDRRLFRLKYQDPETCYLPSSYFSKPKLKWTPVIGIVTPNLNQGAFIERTIRSVIDQGYPNLQYTIQDAVSKDTSLAVIKQYEASLSSWESVKDRGQSHAINLGFARIDAEIMAYLNSDDVLLPGCLSCVANYFLRHPEVDVVYGNRLLIDEDDKIINRWVLPKHDDQAIAWADYIPQETLFWRRRAWDAVGGQVDDSFQFAMDWDLVLRFRQAGMRFARIPRFLGAFRITEQQKTGALISTTGVSEMTRLRNRELGRTPSEIEVAKMLKGYMRRQWYADKWLSLSSLVRKLTDSGIDWTSTQANLQSQRAA
jgi:glycosyltransferase involved in cell wall biosynthesis